MIIFHFAYGGNQKAHRIGTPRPALRTAPVKAFQAPMPERCPRCFSPFSRFVCGRVPANSLRRVLTLAFFM